MKRLYKYLLNCNRKAAISQGAHDGRFSQKIVKDKKKHNNKFDARKKYIIFVDETD